MGPARPLYACIACIICTQSTLGQTIQQGLSRLIGVAVGGALGTATLLLGAALDDPWVRIPALGAVCVAGVWICLLLKRPTACGMACILPCVILITGVTGVTRYYYAAARIIETVVGLLYRFGGERRPPRSAARTQKGGPAHAGGSEKQHEKALRHRRAGAPLQVPADSEHHAGRPGAGLRLPLPAGALGRCREWLECAKFAGYAGFNATMPHKEELVELDGRAGRGCPPLRRGEHRLYPGRPGLWLQHRRGGLSPRPERRGHRPCREAGAGAGGRGRPRRCASSWPRPGRRW